MKQVFFLLCSIVSLQAFSQTTYLADTAFITDIGYGGAPASCRAPHMGNNGWQMERGSDVWVADVFTIPSGSTWTFDTVIIYGDQPGSGTTSSFLDCNLQIYDGAPGLGGSVIWGDTVTNVLAATGFTGIYRGDSFTADGGLTSTNRPIMYLRLWLASAPTLAAGTYWLSWSAAGSEPSNPSCPQKVLPGRVNPSGQMARQFYGGSWNYISDSGNAVGFGKIIKAKAGLASTPVLANNTISVLNQNAPNPFTATTEISWYLPVAGYVKLTVYNKMGQLVATPVEGMATSGLHRTGFNADNLPAGTYYYRLQTEAGIESRQMALIR